MKLVFFFSAALLVSACAHIPTYERGALMSRAMVGPGDSLEQGVLMHVNQTREAMLGAAGGGGASCGCN